MKSVYQFMCEYIDVIRKVTLHNIELGPYKNVLKYKEEIYKRGDSPLFNDELTKACKRLFEKLADDDVVTQDRKIFDDIGLGAQPYEILAEDIYRKNLVGWTACFTDDYSDEPRYEPVWFDEGTTYQEAVRKTKEQYKGIYYIPDGLRLESKVYKHRKTYVYRGQLITEEEVDYENV